MTRTTYQELDSSLGATDAGVEASEAHGCLCGALCADQGFQATEWATELLPDDADFSAVGPLVEMLTQLREDTLAAMTSGDMDFQPLLPGDESPLEDRVRALAAWCGGFLYGLGRSGVPDKLPEHVDEILQDFSEISRATLVTGEAGEEAEGDYVELTEFVRASVQLAYEELAPQRASIAAQRGGHH